MTVKRLLFPLLHSNSLKTKTKLKLNTAVIRPAITYGCEVWGAACKTLIRRVQTMQNKCLKLITDCPMYTNLARLHDEMQIAKIKQYINTSATKFYRNTAGSKNKYIRHLGETSHNPNQDSLLKTKTIEN